MAFHLIYNTVPMSTTWVFLGLLGGREIAMNVTKTNHKTIKKTLRIIGKDILLAFIGLVISIIIAMAVNPLIREEITGWLN
jgi:phosphate/sulfate permease